MTGFLPIFHLKLTVAFYTMIIPVSAKIANKFYSEVQFSVYLKSFYAGS